MKKKKTHRKPKHSDVEIREAIAYAIDSESYVVSEHALDRMAERKINLPQVKTVLLEGFREKRKDEWKEEFGSWNYAISMRTEVPIRVCINIDIKDLLIITVMWIGESDEEKK